MRISVQQEILRSDESRYDHKLHGILLVSSGYSSTEVAKLFGHSPRTVQYWVHRFEQSGFAGLQEIQRSGRPTTLDAGIRKRIVRDLRRSPRDLGYSQNLWDGKLLSHHLSKQFGVDIGVRQCQRIFDQLGFRRRKPRPVIANAKPMAQHKFKKTSTSGA
jgi:transposase